MDLLTEKHGKDDAYTDSNHRHCASWKGFLEVQDSSSTLTGANVAIIFWLGVILV